MKDIITVGIVNYTSLNLTSDEHRINGYIRALAKRGVQLIIFPQLNDIKMNYVQECIKKYGIDIILGLLEGDSIIYLKSGRITNITGVEMIQLKNLCLDIIHRSFDKESGYQTIIKTLDLSEKNNGERRAYE